MPTSNEIAADGSSKVTIVPKIELFGILQNEVGLQIVCDDSSWFKFFAKTDPIRIEGKDHVIEVWRGTQYEELYFPLTGFSEVLPLRACFHFLDKDIRSLGPERKVRIAFSVQVTDPRIKEFIEPNDIQYEPAEVRVLASYIEFKGPDFQFLPRGGDEPISERYRTNLVATVVSAYGKLIRGEDIKSDSPLDGGVDPDFVREWRFEFRYDPSSDPTVRHSKLRGYAALIEATRVDSDGRIWFVHPDNNEIGAPFCLYDHWKEFNYDEDEEFRTQNFSVDIQLRTRDELHPKEPMRLPIGKVQPLIITIVDPNPEISAGHYGVRYNPLESTDSWKVVGGSTLTEIRKGTCADGVSLLLIRVETPGLGKVRFDLEGADAEGSLVPLEDTGILNDELCCDSSPFADPKRTSVEVEIKSWRNNHDGYDFFNSSEYSSQSEDKCAAMVLFCPPADFGGEYGARTITVKARYQPKDSKIRSYVLEKTADILLVRQPVVLVHGTYDNPRECWQLLSDGGPNENNGKPLNTSTMFDRLTREGFRVWTVDYQDSSGKQDDSGFERNRQVVWKNGGGICDALAQFRKDGIAATRVDLVCHSLGGVVSRLFIESGVRGLGYERPGNYYQGDVNRLITISSTHRGSAVMGLFDAYRKYVTNEEFLRIEWVFTDLFLRIVDNGIERITSDAPVDQIPGCPTLRAIPATRVRSHSIACVAMPEDLKWYPKRLQPEGSYQFRSNTMWWTAHERVLTAGVGGVLNDPAGAKELIALKVKEKELLMKIEEQQQLRNERARDASGLFGDGAGVLNERDYQAMKKDYDDMFLANAERMRFIVFGRERNDCTVSESSSQGGLKGEYTTTLDNVLHGFAPQYASVQNAVVNLLKGVGKKCFDPNGFPKPYP